MQTIDIMQEIQRLPLSKKFYVVEETIKAIKREELGHLSEGAIADVSIFTMRQGKFGFYDLAGYKMEGKQKLYVNPGFGFLGYPGRVGILPEITVIELDTA